MKSAIKIIILTIATLASLKNACADIPVPKGWYADASAGITNSKQKSGGSNTDFGFNANVGYKFLPFFGTEAGYTSYGVTSNGFTGDYSIDAAAKAIIPFQEIGAEIYAKLGAAYLNIKHGSNTTNLYYGFGADYWLTPHFAMLVQWMQARGDSDTGHLYLASLGVGFLI
jgi:hypothetical protein